jgi:LPXTG-motif cell wall-anchored protein
MRFRAGLCLIGALGIGALAAAPVWAQSADVSIVDDAFQPREIEVESGTTVTWTNEGGTPHTVTADNGSFESGNLDPGDDFSETFADSGRYPYYCEYHGGPGGEGMSGVVVVSAGGGGDGGGTTEDPTDSAAPDTTVVAGDETDLPQTGTAVDAFLYLALALIASGAVLVRLGSPAASRR